MLLSALFAGDNKEAAKASTGASEPIHAIVSSSPSESSDKCEFLNQIDNLQQVSRDLAARLETCEVDALELRRLLVSSEEKVRRSGELLEEERRTADVALKEYRKLATRLTKLQRWTDCMDDEEAGNLMRKLYHDSQNWMNRHFGCTLSKASAMKIGSEKETIAAEPSVSGIFHSDLMFVINKEILEHIFRSIFARFMIGFGEDYGRYLYQLDQHISQNCPLHVWQHWRAATSSASALLTSQQIDADCDWIVHNVEYSFGQYSRTEVTARTRDLKALLRECIEFKKRLECQASFYYFFWGPANRPFHDDRMVSVTTDDPTDQVIESSVWPMLYKVVSGGEVVVQKELVRTMARHVTSSSDEDRSQGGSEDDSRSL